MVPFGISQRVLALFLRLLCSSAKKEFKQTMKINKFEFLLRRILRIDESDLDKAIKGKTAAYEFFFIPKKQGERVIHGLTDEAEGKMLAALQRKLLRNFLQLQPLPSPVYGFVKGESYQSYLLSHTGHCFFMRVDIRNFFDSITEKQVRDMLKEIVTDEEALEAVYELCTLEDRVPQGAVTSPAVSNLVFARADQRILKYCQKVENQRKVQICYTRYADDLLFSSDQFDFRENLSFLKMLIHILKEFHFSINRSKTIMTQDEISMNGYVVGNCIRLSKSKTENLRKLLYCLRRKDTEEYRLDKACFNDRAALLQKVNRLSLQEADGKRTFDNLQQLIHYLGGCRSWLIAIARQDGERCREIRRMQQMIKRIELVLEELTKLEEEG